MWLVVSFTVTPDLVTLTTEHIIIEVLGRQIDIDTVFCRSQNGCEPLTDCPYHSYLTFVCRMASVYSHTDLCCTTYLGLDLCAYYYPDKSFIKAGTYDIRKQE
jgi:hypothetical protein